MTMQSEDNLCFGSIRNLRANEDSKRATNYCTPHSNPNHITRFKFLLLMQGGNHPYN